MAGNHIQKKHVNEMDDKYIGIIFLYLVSTERLTGKEPCRIERKNKLPSLQKESF